MLATRKCSAFLKQPPHSVLGLPTTDVRPTTDLFPGADTHHVLPGTKSKCSLAGQGWGSESAWSSAFAPVSHTFLTLHPSLGLLQPAASLGTRASGRERPNTSLFWPRETPSCLGPESSSRESPQREASAVGGPTWHAQTRGGGGGGPHLIRPGPSPTNILSPAGSPLSSINDK